jgi:hypothetical protein
MWRENWIGALELWPETAVFDEPARRTACASDEGENIAGLRQRPNRNVERSGGHQTLTEGIVALHNASMVPLDSAVEICVVAVFHFRAEDFTNGMRGRSHVRQW